MVYQYDLISGKVNMVMYQPGMKDAFYHRYTYDAENRLTDVETSADSIYWEHDAYYSYYLHGPLARTIIGQQQVQGMDYAYTLQGWLKVMNSTAINTSFDMGNDGGTGNNKVRGRDVVGFALNYFGSTDYEPISTTKKVLADGYVNSLFKPLYNGNIAAMQVNIGKFNKPLINYYSYDQLNRLKGMQVDTGLNSTTNTWTPVAINDYKESVTYDANGNIISYNRNGTTSAGNTQGLMDALSYKYYYYKKDNNNNIIRSTYSPSSLPTDALVLTNKLAQVTDNTSYTNYFTEDIDNQDTSNYEYDSIGNMIKDVKEGITNIDWTVYGKIQTITKTGGITINYTYDAAGNRISKNVNGKQTWYVRDASGIVMSVYAYNDTSLNGGALTQSEVHLYGSSRLGMIKPNIKVDSLSAAPGAVGDKYFLSFTRGKKFFELSNHLGNVLVTISDKKVGVAQAAPNQNKVAYYLADVVSANDYAPFGMSLVGRTYSSGAYRFGFNGKEKDPETYGEGNVYDYGFRIYNPRIGKFLSVDPITKDYPQLTPYQFAGNTPLQAKDLDGGEPIRMAYAKLWGDIKRWWNSSSKTSEQAVEGYQLSMGQVPVDNTGSTNGDAVMWAMAAGINSYSSQYMFGGIRFSNKSVENIPEPQSVEIVATKEPVPVVKKPTVNNSVSTANKQASFANNGNTNSAKNTTTVYRTQGGIVPNASQQRVIISQNGSVNIDGNEMLYVTLNDKNHSIYFYNKRGGSDKGASIISFEIPQSLADDIKNNAVPQALGKVFPDKPQISDPTKSNSAFGLPKEYIEKLRAQAVQGSGKVETPQLQQQ